MRWSIPLWALVLAAPSLSAIAAPASTTDTSTATTANAAATTQKPKPAKIAAPVAVTPWTGTWSGSINEVGRSSPYTIEVTLTAKGGETQYPDQKCTGKLVRVGGSGDYAFFLETIAIGKFDPATKTGCLDGSLTLEKSGDNLVLTWMTGYNGKAVVAYGSLIPKAK